MKVKTLKMQLLITLIFSVGFFALVAQHDSTDQPTSDYIPEGINPFGILADTYWAPAITLPAGNAPNMVRMGDVNNDSYNDIVSAILSFFTYSCLKSCSFLFWFFCIQFFNIFHYDKGDKFKSGGCNSCRPYERFKYNIMRRIRSCNRENIRYILERFDNFFPCPNCHPRVLFLLKSLVQVRIRSPTPDKP